jgi:hypothetical protein
MIAQLDTDYIRTRPLKALSRLVAHLMLQGRPLTTRARWLNRLLFAQFALVKRLPQLRSVDKPVFILGTGRSGSTILGKLLSIHPWVSFLNEPKALWHAIHPEEDLIGSYSRGPARYRLGADDVTPALRQAALRLYGYSLALTGSRRIVDKYPEMIFRVPFVRALFPDARLIFLVRDGWDAIHSIAAWSRREGEHVGQERHDWWGVEKRKWQLLVREIVNPDPTFSDAIDEITTSARHEDMGAVEWIATMREGLQLMQSTPEMVYQVRFERLIASPEPTLKDLLEFCELPEDPVLLRYAQRVVTPVPARPPLNLSPAIRDLFLETMQALNYPIRLRT